MTAALTAAFTPDGALHLDADPDAPALSAEATGELVRAFAEGPGEGLLVLNGPLLDAPLPPSLHWLRDVTHPVMAGLCALPDLDVRKVVPAPKLTPPEEQALLDRRPPMPGAEYVDGAALARLHAALAAACTAAIGRFPGTAAEWLTALNPLWNTIGRIHFHLAERKSDAERPFGFLATYTTKVTKDARAQHVPLARAQSDFAGAANRAGLLSLLQPMQRAAAGGAFLRALVDSGRIYQPMAWTPAETLQFLRDVPAYEAAGVIVRIPDWWKPKQPPRPQVRVTVGSTVASGVGLDALLDFQVNVALDGENLTAAEWAELKAAASGLVKLRGRWVELDREKLEEVLGQWEHAKKAHRQGLSFLEAMRLLSGADAGPDGAAAAAEAGTPVWAERVAGPWLERAMSELADPANRDGLPRAGALKAELRPYQGVGVGWMYRLGRLGLGGCLADDMGLGKTIQVLALMLRLQQDGKRAPHLLVVPASLMANWQAEAARFAPSLKVLVAHPSALGKVAAEVAGKSAADHDVVITSYGYLARLPWAREMSWDLLVLDEAQAIKNAGTTQSRLVKSLKSRVRLALTGTPVENRPGDLWSLFDFLNPGLLGSAKAFTAATRDLSKRNAGFAPLRRLIRPYILRRLKTDRNVAGDLPPRTEMTAWCALTKPQIVMYRAAVDELAKQLEDKEGIQRRGLVLSYLMRFKQICNHPSQASGDGTYRPADSAKFARLAELCEPLAQRQEKVLVFTQFAEMTAPIADHLAGVFERPGAILHGGTKVADRRKLVERFQEDASLSFMVLSLKAGGTGLNLTAASHVIHFDRWWNPAVEDQATDRAHRIGQQKPVMVHKFTCRGTVEERIEAMLADKRTLSRELLSGGGEVSLTELSDRELLDLVRLDIDAALTES